MNPRKFQTDGLDKCLSLLLKSFGMQGKQQALQLAIKACSERNKISETSVCPEHFLLHNSLKNQVLLQIPQQNPEVFSPWKGSDSWHMPSPNDSNSGLLATTSGVAGRRSGKSTCERLVELPQFFHLFITSIWSKLQNL